LDGAWIATENRGARVGAHVEVELRTCDGDDDHVQSQDIHLPKAALSKRISSPEGVSSRRLRRTRPETERRDDKGCCGVRPT
jgi:putative transposase